MLRFSKWSFIIVPQFFLLIVMAVWNIKQTTMKDYNIQSFQWMSCDRFRQPTKDHQYELCQKYFLRRTLFGAPNENFVLMYRTLFEDFRMKKTLHNKSGLGKSWQIVDFMFTFEEFWFLDGLSIKQTISIKRTHLSCTNGVHFIEIALSLLKRHVEFN